LRASPDLKKRGASSVESVPRKKQIILILAVLAIVVALDQVTKALILKYVPEGRSLGEGPGPHFFQITHRRNPGLVGGMFSNNRFMAYAAPVVAMGVLVYLFRYLDPRSRVQSIAYGMIAGGAVGNNLLDRIIHGSVTDFLQFHFYFVPFDFPWKHYPAFNVADTSICTGVFLLVITWYFIGKKDVPETA